MTQDEKIAILSKILASGTQIGQVNLGDGYQYNGCTINPKAEPSPEVINTIKAQDISEEVERERSQKGAPSRYLFCIEGDDKIEDVENKRQQTTNFLQYLTDYKLLDKEISASKNDEILKAIVCFIKKWGKKMYTLSQPSVPAITRFLKQDCKLKFGVDEQTVINVLRNMLGQCDPTTMEQVEIYF